jgi:hypothetical protein
MKKGFLLMAVVAMFGFTSCKENASDKVQAENVEEAAVRDAQDVVYPEISFEKIEHDFGTIEQGTNVEHTFTFTNTGRAPLVITNATSSCGCTVPNPPKDPIAPGETGELLVKFNGTGQNQVTKTINLTTNTENGNEQLKIKAFVQTKETQS